MTKRPTKRLMGLVLGFCLIGSVPLAADDRAALPQVFGFEHTPVTKFAAGEKIPFEVSIRGNVDWVTLYFRIPGIEKFQARPMAKSPDGTYIFEFDTSSLARTEFEYYIEAEQGDRKLTNPPSAPSQTNKVAGTSTEPQPQIPDDLPSPEAKESKFVFPLSANGTVQGIRSQDQTDPNLANPNAAGNFKIAYTSQPPGGIGLGLDSNFSFTNTPPPADKSVDLTNMNVMVTSGPHALRAGDININESEYTAFGLGRRGIEYAFDNQKASLHLFDVSSQQVKGFKGLGIPAGAVSILGGAAGIKFFNNAVALKTIYITGKDNPNQGTNVGSSPSYVGREGVVVAGVADINLFRNAVKLKAEYARSSYDGDLKDDSGKIADHSLNAGASFSLGGLSIGGAYHWIGAKFNSIGLQAMMNDRKGYDASIGYAKGIVSLQGTYSLQEDNVADDPERYKTKGRSGNVLLSLALSANISANFGYRRVNQNTYQGEILTLLQDSLTSEFSGGLNVTLSPSSSINLTMMNTALTSENNPSGDNSALTVNLGGSFRAGKTFTLNPSFGLTISAYPQTTEKAVTLNTILNGELYLFPGICSLLFSGSFNRAELAAANVSTMLDAIAGINLYLGKLIKINSLVLGLKANLRATDVSGLKTSNFRIMAQGDFAF